MCVVFVSTEWLAFFVYRIHAQVCPNGADHEIGCALFRSCWTTKTNVRSRLKSREFGLVDGKFGLADVNHTDNQRMA